jgi:ABC-type nitrate/sulfonate/bicarbonate transport system substrate-binding protein
VTGVKHGFFRAQGLDLELAVFGGGRTSQAMTAGAVDISVQSGTEMAFLANGVPARRWLRLRVFRTSWCWWCGPICRSARQ